MDRQIINEIINNAVEYKRQLTIAYSKDGIKSNTFHLSSVVYSPRYSNDYIVGRCYDYDSELSFKVDKIINAEIEWVDVLNPDIRNCQDGLYIIAERGDMCIGFQTKKFKLEEWKSYVTYAFSDDIDVLAYHFVPYYEGVPTDKWIPFDANEDKVLPKGKYVFAVTQKDTIVSEDEDCDLRWDKSLLNNGIYYCNYEGWHETSIKELRIPKDMKVLAYHYCTYYNEYDHSSHWALAQMKGLLYL